MGGAMGKGCEREGYRDWVGHVDGGLGGCRRSRLMELRERRQGKGGERAKTRQYENLCY